MEKLKIYGNISKLPTLNFFYGMKVSEEVLVEIAPGKTIIVQLLSIGLPNEEGYRTVFFRINGQPRNIDIFDQSLGVEVEQNVQSSCPIASQNPAWFALSAARNHLV